MTETSGYGLRRRSREMALQLLFQREFTTTDAGKTAEPSPQVALRKFNEDFGVEREVAEYGGELFLGVSAALKEIDGLIQSRSAHWKVSRMGLVDVSVMRIAIFEMKYASPALPPSVAIDEAVELAKKFGSTESGAFVNGILDQVAKGL